MGDINNYINTNFNNDEINSANNEITNLLNIENEYFKMCNLPSLYIDALSSVTIFGIIGFDDFINITTLIPNLFRICYSLDKLIIPNICNQFIYGNKVVNYAPKILDENTIKSLLYYNVPCNTKYYKYFETDLIRVKIIKSILLQKKLNTTNSSFTDPVVIFNNIYTEKSMLRQLILFYRYLYAASFYISNSEVTCDFIIKWESTHSCICNNNTSCDKIVITGNLDGTFNFPINSALLLNKYYTKTDNKSNEYTNNSIFKILNYASNVYNDILLKINYYISNLDYCEQDYMNENNISKVTNIYNNFYKNQLETLTFAENSLCYDFIPIRNNLDFYLLSFNNTYKKTYPNRYFLKNIILKEDVNAITVYTNIRNWNNTLTEINYYYYYITIYSPTPYMIENINSDFPTSTSTYTNVIDFVNEFNIEYSIYSGIKNYTLINTYKNGGFYPKGGTEENSQNVGYLYNFKKSTDNSYIYETLESYSPYNPSIESNGKGVSLLIDSF